MRATPFLLAGLLGLVASTPASAQAVRGGFTTNATQSGDDWSWGPVNIGFDVRLGAQTFNQLHIGSNGYVTFGAGFSNYGATVRSINDATNTTLAAFSKDLYINPGVLTYGAGTVGGLDAFSVFWNGVGAFRNRSAIHTFQLVLIDRGAGNFDFEYNFDRLDEGAGADRSGYETTEQYFVRNADIDLVTTSQGSTVAGRHVYAVRGGRVDVGVDIEQQLPPTAVPEPASVVLLGSGLAALGGVALRRRRRQR